MGLNPSALHALWTLDGLGAIAGADPAAIEAARNALYHPAGAVRRAALMVLPRDARLEADIFAAGMLPDRPGDFEVGYSVPASLQQDADAGVRLQAVLALSELPPSERVAASLEDILFAPPNARDRWLPDAVGIAGAKQGREFLFRILARDMPNGGEALAGVGRAVRVMTQSEAAGTDAAAVVSLIQQVPVLEPAVGQAVLEGVAAGWPAETPPTLTDVQRLALEAAHRRSPDELDESFTGLAERWDLPDVFGTR